MKVGKSIGIACAKYNKTKGGLAKHAYVSNQTVSNWATDKTEPNHNHLALIADYFKLKVSEFIALSESR